MKNGVNIAAISEIVEEISRIPEQAQLKFSLELNWFPGASIKALSKSISAGTIRIARDFDLSINQLSALSCINEGASPQEYLLAALGGCVLITYVYGATMRGITLTSLKVEVSASLDSPQLSQSTQGDGVKLQNLKYRITIDGDGSDEQFQELAAQTCKFSPNHRTIIEPNNIIAELVIDKTSDIFENPPLLSSTLAEQKCQNLKVELNWRRGVQVEVKANSASREINFQIDQPKQMLGIDAALNPQEYLLASLGADVAYTYTSRANLKGINLTKLQVEVTGRADLRGFLNVNPSDEIPVKVYDIGYTIKVSSDGTNQELEQIKSELIDKSSIQRTLTEANQIEVELIRGDREILRFFSN